MCHRKLHQVDLSSPVKSLDPPIYLWCFLGRCSLPKLKNRKRLLCELYLSNIQLIVNPRKNMGFVFMCVRFSPGNNPSRFQTITI